MIAPLLLSAGLARAATGGADALVRAALARDPAIAAARAEEDAARALAAAPPGPGPAMVGLDGMAMPGHMAVLDVMVEQEFMAPGAGRAGQAGGRAAADAAAHARRGLELAREAEVRAALAMLGANEEVLLHVAETAAALDAQAAVAQGMLARGMAPAGDLAMVAMARAELAVRAAVARQEAEMARARLRVWCGELPPGPVSLPPGLPSWPAPGAGAAPMAARMVAMAEMAAADAEMAARAQRPGFALRAGWSLRNPGAAAVLGDDMPMAGVSLMLPAPGARARAEAARARAAAAGAAAGDAAQAVDLALQEMRVMGEGAAARAAAAAEMERAAGAAAAAAAAAWAAGRGGLEAVLMAHHTQHTALEMDAMARGEAWAIAAEAAAMAGYSLLSRDPEAP